MLILALDLASKCGWSLGGHLCERPASGVWNLVPPGAALDKAAYNLGQRVRDVFEIGKPDQVWVEGYIGTDRHPDQNSLKVALLTRGSVLAVCGCYGVPMYDVAASTARKAFCGRAAAHPPRKAGEPPWPERIARQRRLDTKEMVYRQAVKQGLLSVETKPSYDRADSVCIWSYAACKAGRTPPLVLS